MPWAFVPGTTAICAGRLTCEVAQALRILIVQSTTRLSSEVEVLRTLLASLPCPADGGGPALKALLIQGVDGGRRAADNHDVTAAFRRLPGVSVRAVNMGKLGSDGMSLAQRARKVGDVVRVKRTIPGLLRLARRFQPHLVYSAQQIWDLRLATPLARDLGLPQLIHLHYTCGPWLGAGAMQTLRQATAVICVSDFIQHDAARNGVPPARLFTLRNAMKPAEFEGPEARGASKGGLRAELSIPENAVVVGMAARLAPFKGQEELLSAMLPILLRDRLVHLVFAGAEYPGPNGMSGRMAAKARAHGVAAQVHLLGHRSDVPRILSGLDVFAHPSLAEPCSIAVLEAMAHGLPVVAWREGGTTELVADNQTGLLVDTMDLPGLTAALARLVLDSACRATMGGAARSRLMTDFSPARAGVRWLELLQQVGRGQHQMERQAPA